MDKYTVRRSAYATLFLFALTQFALCVFESAGPSNRSIGLVLFGLAVTFATDKLWP